MLQPIGNPGWAMAAGERGQIGSLAFSRSDIVAFASEFDAQPFHLDESAAETTLLGGLAASGWHTCAVVMGLLRDVLTARGLSVEPAGVEEVIWLKPVRPGDRLSVSLLWHERTCATCGDSMGSFPAAIEAANQLGTSVMRWRMDCLVHAAGVLSGDWPPADAGCPVRKAREPRVIRRPGEHGIKFFEHVEPGDEIDLGSYAFAAAAVRDFRARYDGASSGASGDPARVSPWHITAAWMHCIVRYYGHHADLLTRRGERVPMLGPAAGVKHIRWHKPVRAGDTISFRAWAERKVEIATHDDWGLLVVGAEGMNERGDAVVSFYPQMLLERSSRTQDGEGRAVHSPNKP